MTSQNYQNHKRYYLPHHFILLPLLSIAFGLGIYKTLLDEAGRLPWLLFSISSFFILYLAIMFRQHYALGNQNRIVRLEFRLRYFELYGRSAAETEKRLTFGQLAALRFASDAEFTVLLEKALSENISADEIKRSIKDWQADDMRV